MSLLRLLLSPFLIPQKGSVRISLDGANYETNPGLIYMASDGNTVTIYRDLGGTNTFTDDETIIGVGDFWFVIDDGV